MADPNTVAWALGAVGAIGIAVSGAMGLMWRSEKAAQKDLAESLKRQALSSETARIAADQGKALAEKKAGELEMRHAYLKQRYRLLVKALNAARVRVDPGALIGSVPPDPGDDEPSAVWHVAGDQAVRYFGERTAAEEAERLRQRPMNPDTDAELASYLADLKSPWPPPR